MPRDGSTDRPCTRVQRSEKRASSSRRTHATHTTVGRTLKQFLRPQSKQRKENKAVQLYNNPLKTHIPFSRVDRSAVQSMTTIAPFQSMTTLPRSLCISTVCISTVHQIIHPLTTQTTHTSSAYRQADRGSPIYRRCFQTTRYD